MNIFFLINLQSHQQKSQNMLKFNNFSAIFFASILGD